MAPRWSLPLSRTPRARAHALFVRESGFECAADESRVELPSVWRAQQPFAPPAVLRIAVHMGLFGELVELRDSQLM